MFFSYLNVGISGSLNDHGFFFVSDTTRKTLLHSGPGSRLISKYFVYLLSISKSNCTLVCSNLINSTNAVNSFGLWTVLEPVWVAIGSSALILKIV